MPLTTTNDLISDLYGVTSFDVENPVTDTVTNSSTEILPVDPSRIAFTIINMSSDIIYLSPSFDPSSDKGILLQSNGGFWSVNFKDDLTLVTRSIHAISSGTSSKIYVIETSIMPENKKTNI